MQHLFWGILVAVLTAATTGIAASPDEESAPAAMASLNAAMGDRTAVHLYFGGEKPPHLRAEQRVLDNVGDPTLFGKQILDELAKGSSEKFSPVVPAETRIRAFFLDNNGTGYADLSIEARKNHPGGTDAEIQTLYAIVNSLVLNVPGVQRVKILIEGKAVETLAGQVRLDRPYTPNMLLIR